MTWKMILEKFNFDENETAVNEQPGWLGWDGWVSINRSDKLKPEQKNGNTDKVTSE